jgi:hypothetical protein
MRKEFYLYIAYFFMGGIFNAINVFIYTGSLNDLSTIFYGATLFLIVSVVIETFMKFLYTRTKIPSFIRVQIVVVLATGLYTGAVALSRPEELNHILNLPLYSVTFFPAFLILGIVFEVIYADKEKRLNDRLKKFQNKHQKK